MNATTSAGACISAKPHEGFWFSCVPVRFRVYQYSERGSVGDAQLPVNMVEVDLHRTLGQP